MLIQAIYIYMALSSTRQPFRWDFPFFRLSLMALNFQGNVISSTFQKPVFWLKQCLPQKIKLSAFRRNLGQPLCNIFGCWDISKTVLGVFLRKKWNSELFRGIFLLCLIWLFFVSIFEAQILHILRVPFTRAERTEAQYC